MRGGTGHDVTATLVGVAVAAEHFGGGRSLEGSEPPVVNLSVVMGEVVVSGTQGGG